MESELLLDPLLERSSLFECERIRLRNDWNNIDHIGELLQDHDVDRLEGMARGLNEEEAAVNAGVGDIAFSLGGKFFSEVGRMLIFDVLDDWVPAKRTSVPICMEQIEVKPTIGHCLQGLRIPVCRR